jgi:hypothetical protein
LRGRDDEHVPYRHPPGEAEIGTGKVEALRNRLCRAAGTESRASP